MEEKKSTTRRHETWMAMHEQVVAVLRPRTTVAYLAAARRFSEVYTGLALLQAVDSGVLVDQITQDTELSWVEQGDAVIVALGYRIANGQWPTVDELKTATAVYGVDAELAGQLEVFADQLPPDRVEWMQRAQAAALQRAQKLGHRR